MDVEEEYAEWHEEHREYSVPNHETQYHFTEIGECQEQLEEFPTEAMELSLLCREYASLKLSYDEIFSNKRNSRNPAYSYQIVVCIAINYN